MYYFVLGLIYIENIRFFITKSEQVELNRLKHYIVDHQIIHIPQY